MPIHKLLNLRLRDAPRFSHSCNLCRGRGRAEMRVQAAGGCGQQIGGDGTGESRVLFVEFFCISLDAVHKLLVCRAEIGGSGIRGIITVASRRGPSLEILRSSELLSYQL